jgi:radical SAM enzyme (TIGR01210 family)
MFTEIDLERKRQLGVILKEIHRNIPPIKIDTFAVGDYEVRKGFLKGEKINRLIIYLRSSGCQWMLDDENGGCAMCGHLAGTTQGKKITTDEYKAQFEKIISQFDYSEIPMVCVYNAGSFFNDNEVPADAKLYIYKRLNEIPEICHIIFESRPEYISEEKLDILKTTIPDKRIEIGIGLESSSEYIRQMCLNKGFKIDEFLGAIAMLKKAGVYSLSYVLQKPPFLSESIAIEDSINTIKWAFEHGVDVVSLEPVSVQKNTLIHLLYSIKEYRPPWIWSVLKVVSQVGQLGLVRIGGFEFFPPPAVCTHNCTMCNEVCVNAIEDYNASNDINIINSTLDINCSTCKEEWNKQLAERKSVETLIDEFISTFDKNKISDILRNDFRNYPNVLMRMGGCGFYSL